jgi:hypothetical protein
MEQLCERQKNHYLRWEEYQFLGEVSGALTQWAVEAFHQLDEQQQYLARRIFVDLVSLGDDGEGRPDCRRQRTLLKLCYRPDEIQEVWQVVDKLAKAHLLET